MAGSPFIPNFGTTPPRVGVGRSLAPPALETMVAATQGYPFLIQLVGDQVWRKTTNEDEIDLPSATAGVDAPARLGQLVHAPALARPQTSTSRSCWRCLPTMARRRCATSRRAWEWTRTTRARTGCVYSRSSLSSRPPRPAGLRTALPARLLARARGLVRPCAAHQPDRSVISRRPAAGAERRCAAGGAPSSVATPFAAPHLRRHGGVQLRAGVGQVPGVGDVARVLAAVFDQPDPLQPCQQL